MKKSDDVPTLESFYGKQEVAAMAEVGRLMILEREGLSVEGWIRKIANKWRKK